jgi:hypothetical protein
MPATLTRDDVPTRDDIVRMTNDQLQQVYEKLDRWLDSSAAAVCAPTLVNLVHDALADIDEQQDALSVAAR